MQSTILGYINSLWSTSENLLSPTAMRALGLLALASISFGFASSLKTLYYKFFTKTMNLTEKYGANTWAVITGGAEGIGRGFARELAQWGFNLVLLDCQRELLDKTAIELTTKYPQIQVKKVVTDFARSRFEEGYWQNLYKEFEGLDISILVNNVGCCVIKRFIDMNMKEMQDMVTVNTFPLFMVTHNILPKMLQRDKRSAVINITSEESNINCVNFTLYGATKAFGDHFNNGLIDEYGDKVDFISITPGLVSTRLTHFCEICWHTCSPDECAHWSLKHLGRRRKAFGHWKHELFVALANKLTLFKGIYVAELDRRIKRADKIHGGDGTKADRPANEVPHATVS